MAKKLVGFVTGGGVDGPRTRRHRYELARMIGCSVGVAQLASTRCP